MSVFDDVFNDLVADLRFSLCVRSRERLWLEFFLGKAFDKELGAIWGVISGAAKGSVACIKDCCIRVD